MKSIFITTLIILGLVAGLTAQKKQLSIGLDFATDEVLPHYGFSNIHEEGFNYVFGGHISSGNNQFGVYFSKVSPKGDILWHIPVFPEDSLIQYLTNVNLFAIIGDTLIGTVGVHPNYVHEGAQEVEIKDSILLLLANKSGEFLGSVHLADRDDYHGQPEPAGLFYGQQHLYVIMRVGFTYYEIWKLNRQLEITDVAVFNNHINHPHLHPLDNGNVVFTFGEYRGEGSPQQSMILLDSELNLIREFHSEESGFHGATARVLPTSDGGFLATFRKRDFSNPGDDTNWVLVNITKFDEHLNREWEYVFYDPGLNGISNLIRVDENLYLGVGSSDDLVFRDVYEGALEGWVFLFSSKGTVLWERYIADTRYNHICYFRDGTRMDCGGYALVGMIDHLKDEPDPFINEPTTWYLTLDENGCWNGNCHRRILITGPETSETFIPVSTEDISEPEASMEVFPNPASTSVTLVHEYPGEKVLRMVNMSGQLLDEIPLQAERSTINLRGMQAGLYIFSVYTRDGRWLSDKRVVVE